MKLFEQYIRSGKEALQHLSNYMEIARAVKALVVQVYSNAQVYVFGSVVQGKVTAASDIDILIVCDEIGVDKAPSLKAMVLRRVGFEVPLQIHIADSREFVQWYLKFIEKVKEV